MQTTNEKTDQLTAEFCNNYMEKLFYFCLKKTGNNEDAEDLSQDIAHQIVAALNKGNVPLNFSAWVWQIARNRYSVWASQKHIRKEMISDSDINDFEIEDENTNLLDGMIQTEQLALLRRELAFIKSDYRDIVVAYYIDDINIREIASSLSLSESAVWQRLHRARKMLKEGMEMSREFGKRSYNPENITFAASGSQPSGLPWNAVGRKAPINILLQASNNPSTVEELSMELGIALPYMEEEVEILRRATLLEKQGDKYVTNFFIMDKDCRLANHNAMRENSKERSRLINEFIDDKLPEIRALGIAGDHIDDNAIRWWLVPYLIDLLIKNSVKGQSIYEPPVRANGESWGFVGYELTEIPENTVIGHNGCGNAGTMFWTYKYDGGLNMWDQCGEPDYNEVVLLGDCIRNQRRTGSFTNTEMDVWKKIDGKYAHVSAEGIIVPDILVITVQNLKEIEKLFTGHKNYSALLSDFETLYFKLEEILKKSSHQVLHKNMGYNIRMELYSTRMMSIHDLLESKVLVLPEDPGKSTLGMIIILSSCSGELASVIS